MFNFVICLITVVVEAFRGIGLNERITILGPGDIRYHFYSFKAIDLMSHMVEQLMHLITHFGGQFNQCNSTNSLAVPLRSFHEM